MPRIAIVGSGRLFREALSVMLSETGYQVVEQAADPASREGIGAPRGDVDLVLTELPSAGHVMGAWIGHVRMHFPKAKIILLTESEGNPQALLEALTHGAQGCIQKSLSFETLRAVVDAVWHDQMVYPMELRACLPGYARDLARAADAMVGEAAVPARPGPDTSSAGAANGPGLTTDAARPAGQIASTTGPEGIPGAPSHGNGANAQSCKSLSSRECQILHELAEGHANKVIAYNLNLSEATVKSHLKSLLRKLGFRNRTQAAIWALTHHAPGDCTRATGSDGSR